MGNTPFKMKGFSYPGASPMRKEPTTPTTPPPAATDSSSTVDPMFGQLNDRGTKIINEQGSWVSLTKGTDGASVKARAEKAGAISGGPDIQ